jgi:hypothetical protein
MDIGQLEETHRYRRKMEAAEEGNDNERSQMEAAEEEKESEPVEVTEKGAAALMQILLERGYFHEKQEPQSTALSKDEVIVMFPEDDCTLIPTNSGKFVTITALSSSFQKELEAAGRLSASEAAEKLEVPERVVERIIVSLVLKGEDYLLLHQGDELLTEAYLDRKVAELFAASSTTDSRFWTPFPPMDLWSQTTKQCRRRRYETLFEGT